MTSEVPASDDDAWRQDYSAESGRQADPETIVEDVILAKLETLGLEVDDDVRQKLRESDWNDPVQRQTVRRQFDQFEEPILPGFGEHGRARNATDNCGQPYPFVCDSCGDTEEFGRCCGQSVCARCAKVWNRDAAVSNVAKLRRLRKVKQADTPGTGSAGEWQKFHHLAISPPLAWYQYLADLGLSLEEAQDHTKDVVKDVLEELRAQGFVARHSFRGERDDGTISDEHDDRGQWKQRLHHGREWDDDVRELLAWKPHYHAVVVSDRVHVTNEDADPDGRPTLSELVEAETGWSIHRIESRDGKTSVDSDAAMASIVTYNLSHTDIRRNINEQGHNRAQSWKVGSYEAWDDDAGEFRAKSFKSHPDLVATNADTDWAAAVVREKAREVLGLDSASTDCGATIPPVDDPDELGRRILNELYPGTDDHDVDVDHVLHHVSEGNISVDVSTNDGGGGRVSVTDAFGEPISDGFAGDVPDPAGEVAVDGADTPAAATALQEDGADDHDHGAGCGCASTTSSSSDTECSGTRVPLSEAREAFISDEEWQARAAHVDQAREADREWPDDAPPFQADPPGDSAPPAPAD